MFEVYLSKDQLAGNRPEGESDADQTRRVLELLALDKEGTTKQQETSGFAGGAFGNGSSAGKGKGRGKGPRRAGYNGGENRDQKSSNQVGCKNCGWYHCKSLVSKKQSDCKASKIVCHECGQKGHYQKYCPKGAGNQKQKARVHFAEAEEHEGCGSGCDDVPPGFQRCQPKA